MSRFIARPSSPPVHHLLSVWSSDTRLRTISRTSWDSMARTLLALGLAASWIGSAVAQGNGSSTFQWGFTSVRLRKYSYKPPMLKDCPAILFPSNGVPVLQPEHYRQKRDEQLWASSVLHDRMACVRSSDYHIAGQRSQLVVHGQSACR